MRPALREVVVDHGQLPDADYLGEPVGVGAPMGGVYRGLYSAATMSSEIVGLAACTPTLSSLDKPSGVTPLHECKSDVKFCWRS